MPGGLPGGDVEPTTAAKAESKWSKSNVSTAGRHAAALFGLVIMARAPIVAICGHFTGRRNYRRHPPFGDKTFKGRDICDLRERCSVILTLSGLLAGCISISRHESDEGYSRPYAYEYGNYSPCWGGDAGKVSLLRDRPRASRRLG